VGRGAAEKANERDRDSNRERERETDQEKEKRSEIPQKKRERERDVAKEREEETEKTRLGREGGGAQRGGGWGLGVGRIDPKYCQRRSVWECFTREYIDGCRKRFRVAGR